jgi:Na+/H+ antiporter NhaD/arsenite permease-like protein
MLTSVIIFAVAYVFIASEKVDKTIVALLGAAAVIGFGQISYEDALSKVDLNVIFLLVGMMVIVNVLALTGVFEWISIKLAQKAKGNGLIILISFLLSTAFLSAFLDNVTTVILMAPVTILICQILELPTIPFLIMEAIFSNIGGTATLVGDPPNILIGSQTHLGFNDFLINLGPAILIIMAVLIPVTMFVFRKNTETRENARQRVMRAKPDAAILEPAMLKRALAVFALTLVGFFVGHLYHLEPGIVALASAMIMVLVCRCPLHDMLSKVEWNTILFFVGLFMLIGALEEKGAFEALGNLMLGFTQGNLLLTVITILWFSALVSSIVDNIPLVISMIPLVEAIVPVFAKNMGITDYEIIRLTILEPLLWALALGACLGGNGSLIGASANVVVSQVARRNGYNISFMRFTRYGFVYMLMSLAMSTVYLYLRYFYFAS